MSAVSCCNCWSLFPLLTSLCTASYAACDVVSPRVESSTAALCILHAQDISVTETNTQHSNTCEHLCRDSSSCLCCCIMNHQLHDYSKPAIQRVQGHSLTFHIRSICCHSNETRAPIAKLKTTQWRTTRGYRLTCPKVISKCAVVYGCGAGHTDTHGHNTFHLLCLLQNVIKTVTNLFSPHCQH